MSEKQLKALRAAQPVLEQDILCCAVCNYGRGATGKDADGAPCPDCTPAREALALVLEALKS